MAPFDAILADEHTASKRILGPILALQAARAPVDCGDSAVFAARRTSNLAAYYDGQGIRKDVVPQ
jgi:hypothetical protein